MKEESRTVKVPLELLRLVKKHDGDRPPGEVLLQVMKDYLPLAELAESIGMKEEESASEVIIEYTKKRDQEIDALKVDLEEVRAMVKGMTIFFKRTGGKK